MSDDHEVVAPPGTTIRSRLRVVAPLAVAAFAIVGVSILPVLGGGRGERSAAARLSTDVSAPQDSPSIGLGPSPSRRPAPPAAGQPWGGLAWDTPVAAALPWDHIPDQLVSWNGRYVGLDTVGTDHSGGVVVASSTDLADWTTLASGAGAPFSGGLHGGRVSLLVGSAGLVAIGPYGACDIKCPAAQVWSSVDGAVWTKHDEVPFGTILEGVTAGPKGIIAIGSRGLEKNEMWYSAAGESWRTVDLSGVEFADSGIASVGAVPDGFVAVGGIGLVAPSPGVIGDTSGQPAAWWSADGLTWTRADVPEVGLNTAPFTQVVAWPYGLVVQQGNGGQWMSEDGRSWKPAPDDDMSFWSRWADDNRVVAIVDGDPNAGTPDQLWAWIKGIGWKQLSQANFPTPWEWYKGFVTQDGVVALARLSASDEWEQVVVLRGYATP